MSGKSVGYVIVTLCIAVAAGAVMFLAGSRMARNTLTKEITQLKKAYAALEEEHAQLAAAPAVTAEPEQEQEEGPALSGGYRWENNPIDVYFQQRGAELSGATLEQNVFESNRARSWKAEMLHAYELLSKQANPHAPELQEHLSQSQTLFLEFADSHGHLEGFIFWSDGFRYLRADVGDNKEVRTGSGFPAGMSAVRAELYKGQTMRLYDLLGRLGVEPEFVFDPAALIDLRVMGN